MRAARNVKYILDHYGKVPSQLVNYSKYKIQFLTGIYNKRRRNYEDTPNKFFKYYWCVSGMLKPLQHN